MKTSRSASFQLRLIAIELMPQPGFPAPDAEQKKFNSRLVVPTGIKSVRRDQVVTGWFAFDIDGLRPVGCKPLSVQINVPCRGRNVGTLLKDLMSKCLRSSDPVASLGESRGVGLIPRRMAIAVPFRGRTGLRPCQQGRGGTAVRRDCHRVLKQVPLEKIPDHGQRIHPTSGIQQVLSTYVLDSVLKPERPDDALAYLAFTTSDLWPGNNWNFVYGQASLRDRTGVWSIFRNGNPAINEDHYQLCLKRTLDTATHETGHILSIPHCTAFHCNMNGRNHQAESDRMPLHFCPVCFRKLCWNLQIEPVAYLARLEAFYRKHRFDREAEWFHRAAELLQD